MYSAGDLVLSVEASITMNTPTLPHKVSQPVTRRELIVTAGCAVAAALATDGHSAGANMVLDNIVLKIAGPWQVGVESATVKVQGRSIKAHPTVVTIDPSTELKIRGEKHDSLPNYNPTAAPWGRGARPDKLVTFECTAAGMMDVATFAVRSEAGAGSTYERGKDFEIESLWATFGRVEGGSIPAGGTVFVDYVCGLNRVDSIVVNKAGKVSVLKGEPHAATPHPPELPAGSGLVANVWVPGRLAALTPDNLYPVIEAVYPADVVKRTHTHAESLLPKSWAKIKSGEPLKILAWGDSVTAGGQASDAAHTYQRVFVDRLKAKYPHSKPVLSTAGWGGRNTDSFLKEPPGTQYNFDHAVIEPKPDLKIMEFVNDAYMTPEIVEQKYSYLLKRFQEIGAEWVIITPHYVRPDWMNSTTVRVESDPRPYVLGVREFCKKHNIAIADASLRWGHLVKEGIPYTTLLCNSINHPDDRGHAMFAAALMELF